MSPLLILAGEIQLTEDLTEYRCLFSHSVNFFIGQIWVSSTRTLASIAYDRASMQYLS